MRAIFNDPALQAQYEDVGYVIVDLLTPNEVAALSATYKHLNGQPTFSSFATSNMSMDANYRRSVSDAVIKTFNRGIEKYMDNCKMFFGIFTSKQPSNERSICPMHQDPAYVDESKYSGITVWVPLIDTNEVNGALEVIDRSQLLNSWPRTTLPRFPYTDLAAVMVDKYYKRLDIKAGQAYIGSSKVFHWSPSNLSNVERVAALAWLAEEESQMLCYYQDYQNPGDTMEVFEVQPEHYIENPLFSRPDERTSKKIGEVPYRFEALTLDRMEELLNGEASLKV
jgi:hypothetical protein